MPRQGTKQVIKTTVKQDRRDLLRDELTKYRQSRSDISSGKPSTGGQDSYQAPRGLGRKPSQPRVKKAAEEAKQAQEGNATPPPQAASGAGTPPKKARKPKPAKPQNLGSPGHEPPAYVKDIGAYQQTSLSESEKDLAAGPLKEPDRDKDRPVYGINPPQTKGELVKDYDARFATAIDAYEARKKGGATP